MCGIAGALITKELRRSIDLASLVEVMIRTINHRGPDDSGVIANDGIALGHARLSVIDLSSAGHQPMISDDGRVKLIFNGEIYNFRELRVELIEKGYHFKSHTDTEVILNGYHLWGREVFAKLRGMFAIAIWDDRTNELIIARDPIGKKPLFYAWYDGIFLFGSEIKAILSCAEFKREENLEAIHHYLSFQYVPSPYSAFQGVKKVPQASYMVISREGKVSITEYWRLPKPNEAKSRSVHELKEELISLLDESVRLRMVSDVPVGAFLSGGVDSSAVVAMMARHSSSRVKTFCIGFDEKDYDERAYARMVAERYDTDHHEMVIRPNAMEILPKLIWHYNEPFADPSAVPTYYVSEIARKHVTVVLNGDGGDESFLGYSRYNQCLRSEWISLIPRSIRAISPYLSEAIPNSMEKYRVPRILRRWLSYMSEKNSRRYAPSMVYFSDQDKLNGYDEKMNSFLEQSSLDLIEKYFSESFSYVGGAAWADIHTYLPDDLLVKVDIASMANSLEARSPLLDHKLMEWAARIPSSQKIVNGESKSILKSAMEPFLPHDVLYRPKMGFGVPIDRWLRGEMKEFAYDTLLSTRARSRGIVKPDYVRFMLDEHCSGERSHHTRLWALLMLELWFEMWIDSKNAPLVSPVNMAAWG